jgi:hypothetical protein
MILKPGKPPTDVSSYGPISILPIIAKLLEKLLLNKINQDSNPQNWIPNHKFGFRRAHSTIQQSHRIANIISKALNNKQYCTAVFLDIAQAFDKVWHPGLLFKIKKLLPSHYFLLLRSCLRNRSFVVKVNNETSKRLPIHSGVPQGILLSPFLKTLYTHNLPTSHKTLIGTFADDTAIFATHDNPATATTNLQDQLILIEKWLSKWKFKVNETKLI